MNAWRQRRLPERRASSIPVRVTNVACMALGGPLLAIRRLPTRPLASRSLTTPLTSFFLAFLSLGACSPVHAAPFGTAPASGSVSVPAAEVSSSPPRSDAKTGQASGIEVRRGVRNSTASAVSPVAARAQGRAFTTAPALSPAVAQCFEWASRRYGMSVALLYAIAQQEFRLNPAALNRNSDGSTDVGLMQINSRWLPTLARYGIREQDLWDPCTNVLVGAWILGDNLARLGPTVAALGAYNARDPVKRERYARQVLQRLHALHAPAAQRASP